MKTSFITRNNTQIIQNNNYITLNNNQTIIANFNNILSNGGRGRKGSGVQMGYPKRSNSVMSVHDNSSSFISRDNSVHSQYQPHDSKLYFKNLNGQLGRGSSSSLRNRSLNFKGKRSRSQQRSNMIPRTTHSQQQAMEQQVSAFSIAKGNSNYIREKKQEFSRNSSRSDRNRVRRRQG